MARTFKKDKRYTDDETMPFEGIGRRLGMPTSTVVQTYDRAMKKLRLRFSSPARRQWLTELLADEPSPPGFVGWRDRKPVFASQLDLRKFPIIRSRRQRESTLEETRDKV